MRPRPERERPSRQRFIGARAHDGSIQACRRQRRALLQSLNPFNAEVETSLAHRRRSATH